MKTKINHRSLKGTVAALMAVSVLAVGGIAQDQNKSASDQSLNKAVAPQHYQGDAPTGKRELASKEAVEKAAPAPVETNRTIFAGPAAPTTASSYVFTTNTSGTRPDLTGSTLFIAAGIDDSAGPNTPIGFDFYLMGVRYNQFSATSNGFVGLSSTGTALTSTTYSIATGTTATPIIAACGGDLRTGPAGKVHYKVIGSAPNRVLVVEFLNMVIVYNGTTNDGTFQARLHETTGQIEFVYGPMARNSHTGDGAGNAEMLGIGFQTAAADDALVSIVSATNTSSVTNPFTQQLYTLSSPIPNLDSPVEGSRRVYSLDPPTPTAPTSLTFTSVAATSMTLNWVDSPDESLYAIYRSTDGTNYTFQGTAVADATSFPATGLNPSTNYFWRVFAVSDGALSTALSGSQATTAAPTITSVQSGNWSDPLTWGGTVPGSGDNVVIASGHTVTIDSSNALNLTVQSGGILQFEATTARTLTVGGSVTIDNGGTFQSNPAGTQTAHVLSLGGNLTNNGTLDFSTNGDTAGAGITFTGAASNTFGGTGGTTDVRAITINKGTSSASVLELMPDNFTVRGVNTNVAGYLTLTNGTFKISGMFTMANRTFTGVTYTIPATGGIWLNNPNYTVSAQASGSATSNNGLFRISQGIYNIGVGIADQMRNGAGAVFTIEGGTINVSGAFDPQNACTYTQSGGTFNVGLVGNNVSAFGTFELFSTSTVFTMSNGTINIHNPSTGGTKVDYRNNAATATTTISGGSVVIGATAAGIYNVVGQMPSTSIAAGRTMRVNNATVFMRGSSVMNDGVIDFTGTSSRYDFGSQNAAMSYGGAGVFGTIAAPFGGVGVSANSTFLITLSAPIICNRVNLFQGGFINSGQITLGGGAATTTVVQIGSTGLTTPGGSFDVSPVHNQGSGGEIVLYAFETTARSTGVEINPTRILTSINGVDNPLGVTITGGDLTCTATGAAVILTSGRLITGSNTLILSSGTATVTRTSGYVDGNFRKTYSAAVSKTFEVGTANGYSPVTANVTAGTFPAVFTASATQGAHPQTNPASSLARYWTTIAPGLTANLTFQYLAGDVPPGWPGSASVYLWDGTTLTPFPGGMINVGPMTLTAPMAALRPGDAPSVPTRDFVGGVPGASPLAATSAVSSKVHATGTFTIDLPLSGPVGIECRGPAANNNPYQIVTSFANAIATVNGTATPGPGDVELTRVGVSPLVGSVSSVSISGTDVIVNLTGVATKQRLMVKLKNVADSMGSSGDIFVPMNVLIGDTNASGNGPTGVSNSDVSQTKAPASISAPVTQATCRFDVNVAGATISSADVSLVKSKAATSDMLEP